MNLPICIDRMSIFQILGVLGGIFHFIQKFIEHSVSKQWVPGQTLPSAAADLGLHCLPMSHKKDARLIWVNA